MAPPATPPPKRVKKNGGVTAPLTNIVGLHTSGDVDDALPSTPAIERPAEPHVTNAPLITPGGSKLVAYTRETADVSPSKTGVPRATTTTGSLLQDACNHLLKIDGRLEQLIQKHYCQMFSPEGLAEPLDPFRTLCTGIMSQQVSGAAAAAIEKKFIRLFNEEPLEGEEETWGFPSPAVVAASDVTFLRQAGLSQRKAEYIQGLAERFASGELSAKILIDASYEELVQKLTAVRGLGLWSVEMFACFNLKRMDVFSTGDLGVQRGMAAFVGRDVNKLKAKGGGKWKYMNEKEMLEIAAPFAPYR
ncbi:MAG: hypothetical protein LQ340_004853 [Diploschistes diacapsis]|nr:MAG: hypothetical protein LQ340_004853 [Diploschistes diacapsis]